MVHRSAENVMKIYKSKIIQNTKTLFFMMNRVTPIIIFSPLFSDLVIPANEADEDPSHTRNSSTTSQASVGYSSQNSGTGNSQPGHSRQSSSGGESSHGR